MDRYYLLILLFSGVVLTNQAAAIERDDTRRLQQQRIERQAFEQERGLLQEAEVEASGKTPGLRADEQTYAVERNASDLGQALYLSLQHHQWPTAQSFLAEYVQLPDQDPLLVHYAQGALARAHGQLELAEAEFRALLYLQPDFLPARLELARVMFENAKEREAEQAFSEIYRAIGSADINAAGVRRTIATYLAALEKRRAWTSTLSVGSRWSDNINRSSASRTCLVPGDSGVCYIERELPKQIKAFGSDVEASLQRRFPLKQHHGLYLRAQADATRYRHHTQYNEASISAQAGYSYRDAGQQILVGPAVTHYQWGKRALYDTWGLHAEWRSTPSDRSMIKMEGDYQITRYRQNAYAQYFDGAALSLYATYFRSTASGVTLFAGLDAEASRARADVQRYQQTGMRVGSAFQAQGYTATAFASYRYRRYGAYNPLLEARRHDNEQGYTMVLTAERWKVAGFVPSLTLRHHKVRSNVGWLYSYDRNEVSVKLEYAT
ncbi:surface lipoprotein assembly modifier [Allopusillimonas ginsengisoli]|uniref:surface lipoprotein assembly modifier n=1 Tax=Allopusillimonas ginsengisoli TaxID=453575 RepID=UPI00101F4B81|nr:surface lipoprotein assembly modifier [Allopusillimonas ginsengisoli]TEA78865.1 DUF560 domain-containing protein [Allopusillimonas ginsengisoli]